jgi:hypothetical protein
MPQSATDVLAVAFIAGSDAWKWHLMVDTVGLYRWYLQRTVWTNLRGVTRADAEDRLRRFAEQSLRGELVIIDTP